MDAIVRLAARRAASLPLTSPLLLAVVLCAPTAPDVSAAPPAARAAAGPHIVIRSVRPAEQPPARTARYGLTRRDFDAIVATVPQLEHAVPVRESTRELRLGERTLEVMLTGTVPQYRSLHSLRVVRGRFLTEEDQTGTRNVAVLDSEIVDEFFPDQSPIGEYIWIDGRVFVVVGEFVAPEEAPADGPEGAPQVFLPLTAMRRRLGDREIIRRAGAFEVRDVELSRIEIRLKSAADVDSTAAVLRQLLEGRHEERDFELLLPFESEEKGHK